ncbi:right-handed parallel beta-helix repeat-containing protein [Nocardiopsis sp. NPDC058789]|uniref:right-handed parallel beta-helix repeat-containing protein n=1 Tax=Nocardiopsis sp. NPDC058789 TaxID=3346634 RepID=UPI00366FBCEE
MYTARISPSDPRAFASLRAVLHDPRHAGTDLYLHLEPGLYTEPHCLEITTRVMVVPVAGPGSVEIAVQGDDSVFAVAGERASLELYGVHVRGAAGHPGVRTAPGTRFRAIDTVFSSGSLKIHGDGTEIVNCRFEDGGLHWLGGAGGVLRDTHFHNAFLAFKDAVGPTVASVEFSNLVMGAFAVVRSTVTVTDCAMTNGGVDADFSLGITQGSDVRVSGLSISGGGSGGVMVTGEGTRAVLTDLRVSDWGEERYGIAVGTGAEAHLSSGRISDATSTAMAVKGTATADGLSFENVRTTNVLVERGHLRGRRLRFRGMGQSAILAFDSRVELSDVAFEDAHPDSYLPPAESDLYGRGVNVRGGRLEADGLRGTDLAGPVALVTGSEAALTSVTSERTRGAVLAEEGSTVTVRGLEATGDHGAAVRARTGATVEVVDARVSDVSAVALAAHEASLSLTSVEVSGAKGVGVLADEGGTVTLEDVVIRDGRHAGVGAADGTSRVEAVRCRIAGNARAGVRAHPHAVVETRDVTFRDNGGGDREDVPGPKG